MAYAWGRARVSDGERTFTTPPTTVQTAQRKQCLFCTHWNPLLWWWPDRLLLNWLYIDYGCVCVLRVDRKIKDGSTFITTYQNKKGKN
jgi:hypothetical protein